MQIAPKPGQIWRYRENYNHDYDYDRTVLIISINNDYRHGKYQSECMCLTYWYSPRETSTERWYWPDPNWELVCDV